MPGSIPVRSWPLAIPRPLGGCSEAAVFKTKACRGFVGYGDADPSNVSPLVHGAEMRVAETRAVNRALRKAYGIGICSVEEIGSFAEPVPSSRESKKLPSQPVNGTNGNYGGPKVRDRLCQLIRQHQLDANLVKSYAVDFCGTGAACNFWLHFLMRHNMIVTSQTSTRTNYVETENNPEETAPR